MICERCFRALRRLIEDAPDLVGHLRSIADPTKAAAFDRVRVASSRPEMPAPVASDLLDASDHITRTLRAWALHVQFGPGHPWRAEGLEAGIDAADAHDDIRGCADVIIEDLDRLVNDAHQVEALCEGVIVVHRGEPALWSVADAEARWSLDDQPRWAVAPCPECDIKTVRVQPGRRRPTRYACTSCDWEANDADDGGLWAEVFAEPVPEVRPHDPRWLTLTEAARLVKRTPGTVRGWVRAGELVPELGRYWAEDVVAVRDRKEGVT